MAYNWQLPDWPRFTYDTSSADDLLFDYARRMGRISGILESLPTDLRTETLLEIIVSEALKTSEIEGEYLSRKDVMSSVKRNLGISVDSTHVADKRAEGVAELMVTVRRHFSAPLSEEMLFEWHSMLLRGSAGINVGLWRTHKEPMQVISGAMGKEKVHFEAPPSERIPGEMERFIAWFNETAPGASREIRNPPVRSAIAHVYFESIHPFEDGNGRIGRALSEKALSQGAGVPVLLSLSRVIEEKKNTYYTALQEAQRSNDLTRWIAYFVKVIVEAQSYAEMLINFTLDKTRFFDRFHTQLNARQMKVVRRMMEEVPGGFEGGMTAKKYMAIAKTSKATATRDLQELLEKKALVVTGGGRSTRYELNFGGDEGA